MRLLIPPFALPDGAGLADIKQFEKFATHLGRLSGGAGTQSQWFKQRCVEIAGRVSEGELLKTLLKDPRDARVVLYLWEHDDEFLAAIPPNRKILRELRDLAGNFRAGHLSSLTTTYFRHFDQLAQITALADTISRSFELLDPRRLPPNLRQLKENAAAVFHSRAPEIIANVARKSHRSFESCVSSLGVPVERPGRFMRACKNEYYVQTVRELNPGETDKVLSEICKSEVKVSPYDARLNLGQTIAGIMIDKCERRASGMPENWLNTLLSMMGDPRRGLRSPAYQKWWAPMSATRVGLVRKWLAGADLRLFLELLEDSSSDAGVCKECIQTGKLSWKDSWKTTTWRTPVFS